MPQLEWDVSFPKELTESSQSLMAAAKHVGKYAARAAKLFSHEALQLKPGLHLQLPRLGELTFSAA